MSFKERNILLMQFSVIVTDEYTGFVPFFEQKIHKDFSKTFKDTFPTFQGLLSVQKRALSLCLFLVLPQHEQFYPEGLSLFAPFRHLRIWVG